MLAIKTDSKLNVQETSELNRVLLFADGDFSFAFALIKDIADQPQLSINKNKKYEVIATDLEREESAQKVALDVQEFIQSRGLDNFITYQQISGINCRTSDAVKKGEIKGPFDRIILNFPTCHYGWKTTVFEDTLHQIRALDLLRQNGQVEFMFWVEKEHGEECKYHLARAQKSAGFILKSRTIADMEKLAEKGYGHVLDARLGRKKNTITDLALSAVYILDKKYQDNKLLKNEEYAELSDEENSLPEKGDAMPLRDVSSLCHTAKNYGLNIRGVLQTRAEYQLTIYSQKSYESWVDQMYEHVQNKEYGKVEVCLKVLVESGKHSLDSLSKDDLFIKKIIKSIEEIYSIFLMDGRIDTVTQKNIEKYHQTVWYTKLKVITGLKIPNLCKKYVF